MVPTSFLIGGVVCLAAIVVALPMGIDAFVRHRGPCTVRCPKTGEWVQIKVSPWREVLRSFIPGRQAKVVDCSQWPEKESCSQDCTKRW